jgi:hypothetical protein
MEDCKFYEVLIRRYPTKVPKLVGTFCLKQTRSHAYDLPTFMLFYVVHQQLYFVR